MRGGATSIRGRLACGVAALAALVPAAAAARTPTPVYGYRIAVSGTETLTWQRHTGGCAGEDGSGRQTIRIRGTSAGKVDIDIQGADAGFIRTVRTAAARETWTRQGTLVRHDCDSGDTIAPTRTCGTRTKVNHFGAEYEGGFLAGLDENESRGPFAHDDPCPFSGYDPYINGGLKGHFSSGPYLHHRRFTIRFHARATQRNELWGELSGSDGSTGTVTDDFTLTLTPTRYQ